MPPAQGENLFLRRHPVCMSRRMVATVPADIRLPLPETSSSTWPRRVNSASVRNSSRMCLGFVGMNWHALQSTATMPQPLARANMCVSTSTAMLAISGVVHRLSCSSNDVSALYRGEGQPAERRHDGPARIAALRYNAPACGRAVHVCQDLDDRARRRRAILDLINGRAIRRQQRYPHDLQPIQSTETHL